jgi:hypothetical protein
VTALLAGLDWSSRAIHAALIPLDTDHGDPSCPPVAFHTITLPKPCGDDTIRIRAARYATRELLTPDVHSVWVEEAYGTFRTSDRVLLPIQGAIVAGVPTGTTVALITADAWRRELGLKTGRTTSADAKAAAESYIMDWLSDHTPAGGGIVGFRVPSEHEVDALCVALAARQILNREAAA